MRVGLFFGHVLAGVLLLGAFGCGRDKSRAELRDESEPPPPLEDVRPRWIYADDGDAGVVIEFSEPATPRRFDLGVSLGFSAWSPDGLRLAAGDRVEQTVRVFQAPLFSLEHQEGPSERYEYSRPTWLTSDVLAYTVDERHIERELLQMSTGETSRLLFLNSGVMGIARGVELLGWTSRSSDPQDPTVHYHRPGHETVAIPDREVLWTAPNLSQLLVVNPAEPVEEAEGVWVVYRGREEPPCEIHERCGLDRQEIGQVHFDSQKRWVLVGLRSQADFSSWVSDLFLVESSPLEIYSGIYAGTQPLPLVSRVEGDLWTVSGTDKLYSCVLADTSSTADYAGFTVFEHDLSAREAPRAIYESEDLLPQVLFLSSSQSVLYLLVAGLRGTALEGQQRLLSFHRRGDTWDQHEVVRSSGRFSLGPVLSPFAIQPGGGMLLVTKSHVYDETTWSEKYEPGTNNGYSVFRFNGNSWEIHTFGDGRARLTPDGRGLLVSKSVDRRGRSALDYVPLDVPTRRYRLADSIFGMSIPPQWPEN